MTFADSEFWINNDQVDKLLKGDNYKRQDEAKIGDIVVYRGSDGEVKHSATVSAIEQDEDGNKQIKVEGLGGMETEVSEQNVEDAWKGASIEYYRKEDK